MSLEIRKIGVIGAGQMGKGIAQVCALAGLDVALNDVSAERISAGIDDIAAHLQRAVDRGQLDAAGRDAAVARLSAAPALPDFRDADMVIEAASESEEVKRKILSDIALVLKPDAIIGTNTSSISITRLAAVSGRPERFIGIHFMNPVPKMALVELIRGIATDDRTFEETREFITKLGKTITVSRRAEGGVQELKTALPALVTMLEGSNEVRRGSIADVLRGARAELVTWNAQAAGITDMTNCGLRGSPTVVKRVFAPKARATKAVPIETRERDAETIAEDVIAQLYATQPALEAELLRTAAGY